MKKILILSLFILTVPLIASADTIIFKDGTRRETLRAWVENDQVKCDIAGIVISYPIEEIERIEKAKLKRRQEKPKQKTKALTKSLLTINSQIPNKKQENILRIRRLYLQLMGFRKNPTFHKMGFAPGHMFRDWQSEVSKLQDEEDRKVMHEVPKETEIGAFDLLLLGQEYYFSKGQETEYSRYQNERFQRLLENAHTPNQ